MMMMFAALLLAGCNSTSKKTDEAAANAENAIKAGVESLDGIASVESSHEEGWTKVKYDKKATSAADIEGKITDTGYTVKGEI